MENHEPYFTLVVPTYNRAHLIRSTLESILQSEHKSFEVLVVDDGSNDNTAAIVAQFGDPRIKYFLKSNGERGAARNFGRAHAKGRYINFFDSDDLMYPNHMTVARALIDKEGEPEFFHLGYDFKDAKGNVTIRMNEFSSSIQSSMLFDNKLSCNGVFIRADIAELFPFQEDRVLASAEDWELWIRLLSRFRIRWSNEITSSVVSHEGRSIRTIKPDKVLRRDLRLIECLKSDEAVLLAYGSGIKRFEAERCTFWMLCYAADKNRTEVFKWARRAIANSRSIILSRRFIASIIRALI